MFFCSPLSLIKQQPYPYTLFFPRQTLHPLHPYLHLPSMTTLTINHLITLSSFSSDIMLSSTTRNSLSSCHTSRAFFLPFFSCFTLLKYSFLLPFFVPCRLSFMLKRLTHRPLSSPRIVLSWIQNSP